ncbi:DUF2812 domain-containing protein [Undibacterium sp. Ji42W]|uniref:DUF2812 domain-containing protein n=1 Tax=Undibacterium sp. Ji42W TaxID=3413039 RepID=UPI003BF1503A
MSETLIKKFKCFWSWEDENEQQWLQEMAHQGLHLQGRNLFGLYSFVQGVPADVVYRLDYVSDTRWGAANVVEPDGSYRQLLTDAGWEHVLAASGWQYWRMAVSNGKQGKQGKQGSQPEIYTDAASKQMKYKRRMLSLTFWICLCIALLSNPQSMLRTLGDGSLAYTIVYGIAVPAALSMAYAMARIYLRIRQLRH